ATVAACTPPSEIAANHVTDAARTTAGRTPWYAAEQNASITTTRPDHSGTPSPKMLTAAAANAQASGNRLRSASGAATPALSRASAAAGASARSSTAAPYRTTAATAASRPSRAVGGSRYHASMSRSYRIVTTGSVRRVPAVRPTPDNGRRSA